MIKKSELVTIEDRTPYLATARWISMFDTEYPPIHIIGRRGLTEDGSRHDLTNCGRVLEYPEHYRGNLVQETEDGRTKFIYPLCSRCGSPEDFERVARIMEDVSRIHRIESVSREATREAAYQWSKTWRGVEEMIFQEAEAHRDELITVSVGDILDLLDEMRGR